MANPPLWAELFFRPELEDDDDGVDVPDTDGGPRDTVDGSRNSLDDVAEPSVGATVTITDALPPPPPPFLRGIRGILSGSSPAMMEPCGGPRAQISPACHRQNGIGRRVNRGAPAAAGRGRESDGRGARVRHGRRAVWYSRRYRDSASVWRRDVREFYRSAVAAAAAFCRARLANLVASSVTTATGANGNRCTLRAVFRTYAFALPRAIHISQTRRFPHAPISRYRVKKEIFDILHTHVLYKKTVVSLNIKKKHYFVYIIILCKHIVPFPENGNFYAFLPHQLYHISININFFYLFKTNLVVCVFYD